MSSLLMRPLARHVLADFYGCDRRIINDVAELERVMNDAAKAAGATIIQSVFHGFGGQGASGVVVIAESHLSVHSWPEHGYVAVDVFTCGAALNADAAVALLKAAFQANSVEVRDLPRGEI